MGSDPFEHKTRRMIYNQIEAHPGVAYHTIKRVLDLTDSTLRYHLRYLERESEIKCALDGRKKCFYPKHNIIFNFQVRDKPETHKLNHYQKRIIDTIKRNPGITQRELVLTTNLKRFKIIYKLKKLLDFGVVHRLISGRNSCYYFISDIELRKNVFKQLILKLVNNEIDEETFLILKKKLE